METDLSFGLWLQKRRKALDLTRGELASRVGISISALRKIEADERRPSKQLAALLASGLEIPAGDREAFVKTARGESSIDRLRTSTPVPSLGKPQAPQAPTSPIPIPLTALVGREIELAALRQMLNDSQCRLITLVGPGGSGKTRLANEVALGQSNSMAFVPLASIDSASLIVPSIADALGVTLYGGADAKVQLLNHLRDKEGLLVLDNLEHLLDGAGVVANILEAASQIKVLCTSREALNLHGEWLFEVGGLTFQKDDAEGVANYSADALFMQCSQRTKAGLSFSPEDLLAVSRISSLVEGMPLAIELAATWVRVLSVAEIAQEIEQGLDILSTTARDMPERHHSIQAVFEHSWNLLSESEAQALARLSVFRGGFDRQAAEQVAEASLAVLTTLVSKSLVRLTGAGRYDLHELLRQYAAAQLETDASAGTEARRRHCAYFLDLAETSDAELRGPAQLEWLGRLEQDHDNLRAALEWSLRAGASALSLRLAGALRLFWMIRTHFREGQQWLTRALEQRQGGSTTAPRASAGASREHANRIASLQARARALEGLALLTNALGEHREAVQAAEQSLSIYLELGNRRGQGDALMAQGYAMLWQGEEDQGISRLREALARYREAGDPWNIARALWRLGRQLADFGGEAAGQAMLEESAAILEGLGDTYLLVGVLVSRGVVAFSSGDYPRARADFERSLVMAREIRDRWAIADALTNIGGVLRVQGDYLAAARHFGEALRIYEEAGSGLWCTDPLCALAENDIAQGELATARSHIAAASGSAGTHENRWVHILVGYFQGLLSYYEGDLERASIQLETVIGLSREGLYKPDLARSLVSLGRVTHARGNSRRARVLVTEAMELYRQMGNRLGVATALEASATLTMSKNPAKAAELFGASEAIRTELGAPLPRIDKPGFERDIGLIRAQLGDDAFARAWERGSDHRDELRE
jgi:predicted ATPase/DNA-binding XRE family transcriptional regulator